MLFIIEAIIILLLLLFLGTQVIYPAFANKRLFPSFRKTQKTKAEIEGEIDEVEREAEIQELEVQLEQKRKKLEEKRSQK